MLDKIAVVSGGFDPIHRGHIEHIDQAIEVAFSNAAYLVVVLTRDDQLVQKKKYCFMPFKERKYILERLYPVTTVVKNIDKDLTCRETLRVLRPSMFLKGGNSWDQKNLPELEVCQELGIRIVYGVGGFDKTESSSDLVRKAMQCLNSQ